jgi:hypothetical protein
MKDTSGLLDLREVRCGRRTRGHGPLTAGDPANPLVRTSSVVPAPAVQDICAATKPLSKNKLTGEIPKQHKEP